MELRWTEDADDLECIAHYLFEQTPGYGSEDRTNSRVPRFFARSPTIRRSAGFSETIFANPDAECAFGFLPRTALHRLSNQPVRLRSRP